MFLKLTEIEFDSSKVVAEFGDDCYGIQHPETGYVGIYVEGLVKNENKTGEEIAKDLWGNT